MILITGASGKTGRAIITALVERKAEVRALVRKADQISAASEIGAQEIVVGDLSDLESMKKALEGIQSVYFICPNMNPLELEMGKIAIHLGREAGVQHFVYHSVLHPQTEKMPHHWQKLRVEENLFESGLSFTILQPAPYMQNILGYWKSITERGIYPVPYGVETRLGMVDLKDVAESAANVLTRVGHVGAIYELAGSEILTQSEVATQLSHALGRIIRAERLDLDVWEMGARASGLSNYAVETLLKMFRYYDQYGLWGNSNTLKSLIGREPTSFISFLERTSREKS
jgi:NAD(P)H dehydrogenase (quinone)